ncbi:MAG TPA: DNA-deoxyinosine glycosylase [Candidatus Limiplasma sp.]|nr:DNA-deoxyinosine glycosylase [Candidatus Limiplasma sp.]HPS82233.1 DNA-deoxyinosine glycosylase [Candidatus Limiplasma sp.]
MAETYLGIAHPFPPVWDCNSRALVLGTFPSVQSRANAFYYGHPQNRFWRVLALLYGETIPTENEDKRALLLRHGIALWDVLASCDVTGSADGSIRNPVPNDIGALLTQAPIRQLFANGQTAAALYRRWCEPQAGLPIIPLPSTSPANAAWSVERLARAWAALPQSVAQNPSA